MNMPEDRDILDELKTLYEELKSYKRLLNLKGRLSDKDRLRETLVRKVGALKTVVIKLTGKEHIQRFDIVYNIWDVGLSAHRLSNICDVALDYCIDAVNEAIGKLESEGSSWGALKDKRGKVKAELPRATKDYEEKVEGKELELILEGTPDMTLECIRSTTEKLNLQGCTYGFRRTSGAPDYAKWDKTYFVSYAISQGDEGQIGTIKLQLLPNERTLFKIPEPKDWDSSFGEFISHLLAEFKRLGFLYFEEEKPPIGFRLPHREKDG